MTDDQAKFHKKALTKFKISFCFCDDKIIRPQAAAMIEEVDTNGDGQINFEEFVNMMTF